MTSSLSIMESNASPFAIVSTLILNFHIFTGFFCSAELASSKGQSQILVLQFLHTTIQLLHKSINKISHIMFIKFVKNDK
jgi:hypothetical protein